MPVTVFKAERTESGLSKPFLGNGTDPGAPGVLFVPAFVPGAPGGLTPPGTPLTFWGMLLLAEWPSPRPPLLFIPQV